jgi:hypothetical protein
MAGATATSSGFREGHDKNLWKYYWDADSYNMLEAKYPQLFEVVNVDSRQYISTSAVGTGDLRSFAENEDIPEVTPIEGYKVIAKVGKFGKMESVTREQQEDFQKFDNFLKSQVPQWNEDFVRTKEKLCANVFNYGGFSAGQAIFNGSVTGLETDTSGNLIYDSAPLFMVTGAAAEHTSKGGTDYYNGLGAVDPTISNIQDALNLFEITNAKNEEDSDVEIMATHIVAAPNKKWEIDEILESQDKPNTADRATNVLQNILKPVYWRYLTNSSQWSVVKAKFGLKLLERAAPKFKFWQEERSENYFMSLTTRFGICVDNWRGIVSANFSTS